MICRIAETYKPPLNWSLMISIISLVISVALACFLKYLDIKREKRKDQLKGGIKEELMEDIENGSIGHAIDDRIGRSTLIPLQNLGSAGDTRSLGRGGESSRASGKYPQVSHDEDIDDSY